MTSPGPDPVPGPFRPHPRDFGAFAHPPGGPAPGAPGPDPDAPPPVPHHGAPAPPPAPDHGSAAPPAVPEDGPPAPPPPPGPGVRLPFAAAPVEGRAARVWLGLGVAGAVLALCCGAGVISFGGLFLTSYQALNEQAHRAVGDYLDAEIAGDFEEAYELRCARDRRSESLPEFRDRVSSLPRIESYELSDVEITQAGNVRVPAVVNYEDGRQERLLVPLAQDETTGELEVCGWRR